MADLHSRMGPTSQNLALVDKSTTDAGAWENSCNAVGVACGSRDILSVDPRIDVVENGDGPSKCFLEMLGQGYIFPLEVHGQVDDSFFHIDWTRATDPDALDSFGFDAGFNECFSYQFDDSGDTSLTAVGSLGFLALAE